MFEQEFEREVYLTSIDKSSFKSKEGEQIDLVAMNFMTTEGNKPLSFNVMALDYAGKYSHLKTANFGEKGGAKPIIIKMALRDKGKNIYKLVLTGLSE